MAFQAEPKNREESPPGTPTSEKGKEKAPEPGTPEESYPSPICSDKGKYLAESPARASEFQSLEDFLPRTSSAEKGKENASEPGIPEEVNASSISSDKGNNLDESPAKASEFQTLEHSPPGIPYSTKGKGKASECQDVEDSPPRIPYSEKGKWKASEREDTEEYNPPPTSFEKGKGKPPEYEILEETRPLPSPFEKGKSGIQEENMVPANYRVYCPFRSPFTAEGIQMQRFIFPSEMPARFFVMDNHRGREYVDEEAIARNRACREENHEIVRRLVYTHTRGILATRSWPCIICGAKALKFMHGLIPHFEVQNESAYDEEGRGFYGASVPIPLTEGKIYRIGYHGGEDAMGSSRRWVNRLASSPIGSGEGEEDLERLRPCVIDVATPICRIHWECEQMATQLGRELAKGILNGTFKADPEDMPWYDAEDALPGSRLNTEEVDLVQCSACGKVDENGVLRCGNCDLVGYCSRACQVEHWPFHKDHCGEMRDRSHAAILVEMSRSGVENPEPEFRVMEDATTEEGRTMKGAQGTRASGMELKEVPNKPKKKNKGRNRGRGKGKGKGEGKGKSVDVGVPDTKDNDGEEESSGTEVGDVDVEVVKGKKSDTDVMGETDTAGGEKKVQENKWLPLL